MEDPAYVEGHTRHRNSNGNFMEAPRPVAASVPVSATAPLPDLPVTLSHLNMNAFVPAYLALPVRGITLLDDAFCYAPPQSRTWEETQGLADIIL
jgi:hypothetical protein